jgi:hypothetical protein
VRSLCECSFHVLGFTLKFFVLFCFFCFRSRSCPVPHRGERVKQRTVQLQNWKHCYVNCKIFRFRWTILFPIFPDESWVPVSFFVCVCRSFYFHCFHLFLSNLVFVALKNTPVSTLISVILGYQLPAFLLFRLSRPQGLLRLEGLGKFKKFVHLIGTRTIDLPACSIVPGRYRKLHVNVNQLSKWRSYTEIKQNLDNISYWFVRPSSINVR